ncbi:uncharacterized protein LOC125645735 [Ostrea edulis]|uniref:uncharacterized protein LOC125645735 n=1 Tax=Ostrea edulis TaxID=37623 RepID=UPI0024AEB275|nr:uncharacterized protein LOC125645735 [Ostrea edulis]
MAISKCLLVALVVVIFATIFQVIALAAPYWFNLDLSIAKVYAGLWWTCTETVSTGLTSCDKTVDYLFTNGSSTDWLKAVQAMSILGFLTLLVASVMTILKLFVLKDNKPVLLVAIGTSFTGAVFILIAIAVYADEINDFYSAFDFNYHFAFAFSIIAMIAAIGAGVAMLVEMITG